ncbi:MAG: DegT/DnrJ/EryC1/StrS family aminotransferase [Tannerella sp.]|nr:DegT/DnrJ/EryC1/StrS family aminotransferase [Tannerella sp.]
MNIPMTDLKRQYERLKAEIDAAIREVTGEAHFIHGRQVAAFGTHLAEYLNVPHVIPCGNGTDAIRLALRTLNIQPGEEVILPAFNYIAAAEVAVSLGFEPVLIDVDPDTFNMNTELLERAISRQTKAIIAVHLFGQACEMEPVMKIAGKYKIPVIEDNAQSLGAEYTFSDGSVRKAGAIAPIGITSFFPTKPLGCYGDGGAVMTADGELAERIRMLANHGQTEKYHHKIVGCNSRLDTIQAAILDVKLKYIDTFANARRQVAQRYDRALLPLNEIRIPTRSYSSTHVYHQYTIRVGNGQRDALQAHLKAGGIAATVYYPLAVHEQEAYRWVARTAGDVSASLRLSREVLSLPIYAEMTADEQNYVIETILKFFRQA